MHRGSHYKKPWVRGILNACMCVLGILLIKDRHVPWPGSLKTFCGAFAKGLGTNSRKQTIENKL